MFAWLLGVIRILYVVAVVVTEMFVLSVMGTVFGPGSVAVPMTPLLLSVIWTRLIPAQVPAASVTVAAVTVSVPPLVWSVKASTSVAAAPGAMVVFPGLVPSAIVVVRLSSPLTEKKVAGEFWLLYSVVTQPAERTALETRTSSMIPLKKNEPPLLPIFPLVLGALKVPVDIVGSEISAPFK